MRRTRPNKRDYQVVIAVDDSRSMSESNCGGVAIEALVTVCRAMSQLEVGNLAVASFGKEGNIRLLHEFDRPFNGEAGVKVSILDNIGHLVLGGGKLFPFSFCYQQVLYPVTTKKF